ncbi:MAG: YCF48-related protein [Pirellulaceae bacterium]
MKSNILDLLTIVCLFSFQMHSQLCAVEPPKAQENEALRDDATLRDICFADERQGWAVGDRGVIWYTPDGGVHWLEQKSNVGCRLDSVHFINAREGWIAGGWYESDTRISRAIVLRTQDGGKTWNRLKNELPRLRQINFTDRRNGTAVGDWSPVHLSARFITFDGGQSWQPAPQSEAGAMRCLTTTSSSIVSLDYKGVLYRQDRLEVPASAVAINHRLTDVVGDDQMAWTCGRDGTVARSRDGDRHWQAIPPLAGSIDLTRYDLECLASANGTVWMAGLPGDRIFFSTSENTLGSGSTGVDAPVHAMHFHDGQTGWAACSYGTILQTSDGGRSWKVQRGGKRHAAVMFVSRRPEGLPWPMLISESLEQGYRSVVVLDGASNVSFGEPQEGVDATIAKSSQSQRTLDNGSGSADPMKRSDSETTMQAIADVGGGDVLSIDASCRDETTYRNKILQAMASSRPMVVVLAEDLTPTQRSTWLSIATSNPSIVRVFGVKPGDRGDVVYHPSAILPAAGVVVEEAWTEALSVVSTEMSRQNVTVADRLLDRQPSVHPIDSLLHRLPIGAGGVARRLPPHGSRTQLTALQPRTRHGDWIKQLLDACTVTDDAQTLFSSRLKQLTSQIRPSDRPAFMRRLILDCYQVRNAAFFRASLQQAVEIVPDSPIGFWADCKLAAIDASEEWTRLPSRLSHVGSWADTKKSASPAAYGSPFETKPAIAQVSNASGSAVKHIRTTETSDLIYRHQPSVLLAQVARLGDEASPNLLSTLGRLASVTSAGNWQALSQAQLLRAQPKRVHQPFLHAAYSQTRPLLDGKLDESMWTTQANGPANPTLRFSYDSEYLYVGIEGSFPEFEEIELAPERQRDADLTKSNRICLYLDVDRDVYTSYQLQIDASGRCHDACDGFADWQPLWFVKTVRDEGSWVAEIAIRRKDLFSLPLAPGDHWFVGWEMLEAGQSATSPIACASHGWQPLAFQSGTSTPIRIGHRDLPTDDTASGPK